MEARKKMRSPRFVLTMFMVTALVLTTAMPVSAAALETYLVSTSSSGVQADLDSGGTAISPNGRYVAFSSRATNLIPGMIVDKQSVYFRDLRTGVVSLISVSSDGIPGNGMSVGPYVSTNGRYVFFSSTSTNLAPGPSVWSAALVRDRWTGTTSRIAISSTGVHADQSSQPRGISPDGRYVVFETEATNLEPGGTNGEMQVYVRDMTTRSTTLVSVSSSGAQGNGESLGWGISANGRYVLFSSEATNLVPGDTNGESDVFLRDLWSGTTTRVSVSDAGTEANGYSYGVRLSADGRYALFNSVASNLVAGDTNYEGDAFVRDLWTGTTSRVSVSGTGAQGNSQSSADDISENGRYVVFASWAANLVPGDTNNQWDIFLRDRVTGSTTRVSVASDGTQSNGLSNSSEVANDGSVTFISFATNLVPGDTNDRGDVFVRTRHPMKRLARS